MVYTRLFGQENIVINSEEIARDLLEHRSQNYSDRPEVATNTLYEFVNRCALRPLIASTNV
jgi:hypothetical protein